MAWFSSKTVGGGGDDHTWIMEQPDSKTKKQDVNDAEWGDDGYTHDGLLQVALLDSQAPVTAARAEQSDESFDVYLNEARSSTSSSLDSAVSPRHSPSSPSSDDISSRKQDTSVDLVHTLQERLCEKEVTGERSDYWPSLSFLLPGKTDGGGDDYVWSMEQPDSKQRKADVQVDETKKQDVNDAEWGDDDYTHNQLLQLALQDSQVTHQAPVTAARAEQSDESFDVHLSESRSSTSSRLDSQVSPRHSSSNLSADNISSSKQDTSVDLVHTLQARLCEKDQECKNLQEKCAALQQLVKKFEQQEQSASGMPGVCHQLSPKPVSPHKTSLASRTSPAQPVSSVSCQKPGMGRGKKPIPRRLQLNTGLSSPFAEATGPQVVCRLLRLTDLRADLKDEVVICSHGLMDLVQDNSISLKIAGLMYSQETDSNHLIPLRPKKQTQGVRTSGTDTNDETVQIVTPESLQLAIDGITQLLQDAGHHPGNRSLMCLGAIHRTDKLCNSGAILILPLLRNYIQHHVNLIDASSGRVAETLWAGGALPKGGTPPGSCDLFSDSSLDSSSDSNSHFNCDFYNRLRLLLEEARKYASNMEAYAADFSFDSSSHFNCDYDSSRLRLLLQEGQTYASNMEAYALTALHCLFVLIDLCPAVRHAFIMSTHGGATLPFSAGTTGSCRSSSSSDEETKTKHRKVFGADDGGSSRLATRVSSSLLYLVLRLACQDLQDGELNPQVVILALRILTCLCQHSTKGLCEHSTKEELPKLEAIITEGILTKCFQQTGHPPVLRCAVRLLHLLATSEKLLAKLCRKSDSCPLYLMHQACSLEIEGEFELQREYVTCLSSIISGHRTGLYFLRSNTCLCTDKLVASLILTLYNLFSTYTMAKPFDQQYILRTLVQGIDLIHTLASGNDLFPQHRMPVYPQYVVLIMHLSSILKASPETSKYDLQIIDELNDFESDSSSDSDEEKKD